MPMYVIKRDGRRESVKFDKITARIEKLSYGLDPNYIQPAQEYLEVVFGYHEAAVCLRRSENG